MSEPIAIIGSACRFPGSSSSPSKLWTLLKSPSDLRKGFPKDRLNLDRFYHPNGEHHGSTDVRGKSCLLSEDCCQFDAGFFNISPMEADGMDPQQRLLLETVYEALESAGYPLEKVHGSQTSVHVGVMNGDFNIIQQRDSETLPTYNATGTAISILSNRVSYFFDLKGPSVTIDTACSSSLVALHQAVQGLRSGDSTAAIVAGANLILDPYIYIAESSLHMLSPDSCSRMWDQEANGYARGEGVAGLLLKPLSRAIADGDHVEAVIRETGVNSDGRTKGITMPSAASQTALIRKVYQNAGLDAAVDGCQYFECHGTGTLAGDPVEAEAIRDAFFPTQLATKRPGFLSESKLYVGSIKTVIGHLEGCAGLAGVMKAVLAIKNRTIPPNMHFKQLNPAIIPFYDHLQVPTAALPWPDTGRLPLRASVNSFGFGGTNAHAIIEGYKSLDYPSNGPFASADDTFIGPLLLSANSNTSLVGNVKSMADRIRTDPSMNLEDLTWTLHARRTVFQTRAFFSGATTQRLLHFMDRFVTESEEGPHSALGTNPHLINPNETPGILGIFTGQGAQWASMGRSLVVENAVFRASIEGCEQALAELADGPSWSLKEELMKDASESRIGEAALSQPLCTALQIGLVDLLRCAGIRLSAVVGHSSGEIAAVYSAGIINASAAIKIAYYRGYHAKMACGTHGETGRMAAVAISFDDALDFCSKPEWTGRLAVAASNSPQSVTLSGDIKAIEAAKSFFDTQETFARILKTDTAYHSHHMLPCVEPYLRSLRACEIEVGAPRSDCIWVSSVRGDTELLENLTTLKDQYWVDNMCNPVLFSQAVETSIWNGGPFDVAVELGPHPALKGPAEQTIKAVYGSIPGYAGVMRRGDSEIEAFSGAVGFVWSRLGPDYVDMSGYHRSFKGSACREPRLLKDLPSYSWNHNKVHWKESRISRQYRLRQDRSQELLGRRVPDDSDDNMRWRNVLRLSELPWLHGHIFQGQVLFPGAGYVVMALEAAFAIANGRPVTLFEVEDIILSRALVVEERGSTETVFAVKIDDARKGQNQGDRLDADFACYFCSAGGEGESLVKACTGRIAVHFGKPSSDALPPRMKAASDLMPVDMHRFYSAMKNVGLDYEGIFRGMKHGKRSLNSASVKATWASDMGQGYLINPGFLDVAFQSVYLAFSSPASGDIWAPYLPVRIGRLAVNPDVCYRTAGEIQMEADASVTSASSTLIEGDIQLYGAEGQCTGLQVEGLTMQAMSEPQQENDKLLFSETVWAADVVSGFTTSGNEDIDDDIQLVESLDRVSLFYWQKLLREVDTTEINDCKWYHGRLFDAIKHMLSSIANGEHPIAQPDWLNDSQDVISAASYPYESRVDMRLIHAVGRNLPAVVRGDIQLLEVMLEEDMLNRFYMEGYGFSVINDSISTVMGQIVHKYPQAHILEIGAGTGGTTRSILDRVGDGYSSYTYTDISPAFFKNAAEKFSNERSKMSFRVLDIEKDIASQGFGDQEYDIIIAANVLHATQRLHETMKHVRVLLKPGGFLLMMEITCPEILRTQFIMGGLPGWWYGVDDGRVLSPAISTQQWDGLLQETGFSGIDHIMHDMSDREKHSFSIIVSQAVDEDVRILRNPISSVNALPPYDLLIIGGKTTPVAQTMSHIQEYLSSSGQRITVADTVDRVRADGLSHVSSIICLEELDEPLFLNPLTQHRFKALQDIMGTAKHVIWAIDNKDSQNPYVSMSVGLGRALRTEIPDLNLQFVDIDIANGPSTGARVLVELLLQLQTVSAFGLSRDTLLWTVEPELRIRNGQRFIPRILPNSDMNDMYNAGRRPITRRVPTKDVCVELVANGESFQLIEAAVDLNKSAPGNVRLQVQYALALPKAYYGSCYLCSGMISDSGCPALAICSSNASVVEVPERTVATIAECQECTPAILRTTAIHLLVKGFQERVLRERHVIVYEPDAAAIEALLATGKRITFASSKSEDLPADWLKIHPRATRRIVQRCLPRDLSCVIDFSGSLPDNIKSYLPADCRVQQLALTDSSTDMLQSSYSTALSDSTSFADISIFCPEDLVKSTPYSQQYVVDWTTTDHLDSVMQQLNATGLLSPNATYLLAGMTGDLGLSLSQWMVCNGARHIVLTSRNPNVDETWLRGMHQSGANVQVYQNDITDRDAVYSLIDNVKRTMPPIAGICNACMVLRDGLFLEMDAQTLTNTLAPKVDGTRYLDEIFHDTPLDFFILFSSLASIIGNAGQSNYHAANLFMTGLAAQRRNRSLAASVIHIGLVTDVGYVARRGQEMEERLRKLFFMPLSESDVHYSFAEAILAGRPNNNRQHEIIIGLQPFVDSADTRGRPPWEHNPRFSHYVCRPLTQEKQALPGLDMVNVKETLKTVKSDEDAITMVQEAFGRKVESIMQLPLSSANLNVPLIDLGCDSLLAIEIRGWFMREVGVDVPVLKVLSGDTASQLCEDAVRRCLALQLGVNRTATSEKPDEPLENPSTAEPPNTVPGSESIDTDTSSEHTSHQEVLTPNGSCSPSLRASTPDSAASLAATDAHLKTLDTTEQRMVAHTQRASYGQSRLWFLTQYLQDPTTYNVIVSYSVQGYLDVFRLRDALTVTICRHQSLQTCFFRQPGTDVLMQGILSPPSSSVCHIAAGDEDIVKQEYQRLKNHIWDIRRGKSFSATIISLSPSHHAIVFGYHHIVMDGMSWHIFLQDLDIAYRMRRLPSSTKQYVDFSRDQFLAADAGGFESQLQFWREQHEPPLPVMPLLPIARMTTRNSMDTYESHVVRYEVDQGLASLVKNSSKSLGATPFQLHLAVIQTMLFRLLDLDDICIGVADANRTDEDYIRTVGFFLNLLPIRFQLAKGCSFQEMVQKTRQKMFAALSNSQVPFDLVLDSLRIPRNGNHSPLFQVAVNYRMGAMLQIPLGDATMEIASADDAKNPYDISFGITDTAAGTCLLELTTQTRLYSREATGHLLEMYVNLLRHLSTNPSALVETLPVEFATKTEDDIALGKGPRVESAWPNTLSERFDDIQRVFPEEVAVKDGTSSLTYSQLAGKVDSLCAMLRNHGLSAGDAVAVHCLPSTDAIICMLATLRLGCVYVPLDTRLPVGRHVAMVENCQPALILCQLDTHDTALKLQYAVATTVDVVSVSASVGLEVEGEFMNATKPDDPAFLFYTSGTSGVPKGILLTQRNFVNHIAFKVESLSMGREVVLQQSSLGFDMSVVQTFCALATGGTLVIVPKAVRGDPDALSKLMLRETVTFTIATPSEYAMMLRYGSENLGQLRKWRQACLGGEVVSEQLVKDFRNLQRPDMKLTNCYGPTEITAAATFQGIPLDRDLPAIDGSLVGKALPNYSVYIVDDNCRALPTGLAGEICIGGAGVALGYLGLPEQTKSRFVPDVYASSEDDAKCSTTMYRTGDKGRLLEDGTLVFMGRMDGDDQVKLRGLRIELGDVSSALLNAGRGLISDAVVTMRGEPPFLVAHVVAVPGVHLGQTSLQQLIAQLPLPQYMLPSIAVPLESLPTNANGKVDKRAIAALPLPNREHEPVSQKPLSLAEGELRLLWEKILSIPENASRLEPDSDFFMQGGNSMLLVRLQGAVKDSIGISVSIMELYQSPTLREMAALVDSKKDHQLPRDELIDWAQETALTDDMIDVLKQKFPRPHISSKYREILLTGSASFLGRTILGSLIKDPSVGKVHCVAVLPEEEARHPASEKVIIHSGSLLLPKLGLSDAECSRLQSRVNVVIHAGANGHCLNRFSSLRVPNLHSTRFLITFAVRYAIPIHYISSSRVTLLSHGTSLPPVSVSSHFPRSDGVEGFTASKWASERMLEHATHHGLDVTFHRACALVGDEAPNEDALNALIKYSQLTRSVPRFENFEGYLDFKDVHEVAETIAREALAPARSDKPGTAARFMHHSSGHKVAIHEFGQHMAGLYGKAFEEVAMADWVKRAMEAGIDPLITGYLEAMTQKGETIQFPYLGERV